MLDSESISTVLAYHTIKTIKELKLIDPTINIFDKSTIKIIFDNVELKSIRQDLNEFQNHKLLVIGLEDIQLKNVNGDGGAKSNNVKDSCDRANNRNSLKLNGLSINESEIVQNNNDDVYGSKYKDDKEEEVLVSNSPFQILDPNYKKPTLNDSSKLRKKALESMNSNININDKDWVTVKKSQSAAKKVSTTLDNDIIKSNLNKSNELFNQWSIKYDNILQNMDYNSLPVVPPHTTIDLHHLSVKNTKIIMNKILDIWWLKEKENRDIYKIRNVTKLFIITGKGNHSKDGKSKIKTHVQKLLKGLNFRYNLTTDGGCFIIYDKYIERNYKNNYNYNYSNNNTSNDEVPAYYDQDGVPIYDPDSSSSDYVYDPWS